MHREPFFVQEVKLFSARCQAAVKRHGNEGLSESLRGSPTARVGAGTQAVGHAGCGVEREWWCGAHLRVTLFLERVPGAWSDLFPSVHGDGVVPDADGAHLPAALESMFRCLDLCSLQSVHQALPMSVIQNKIR